MAKTRLSDFMGLVGQTGKTYGDLWRWSNANLEVFWSAFWDFAGVVGDKGSRILTDADKMPGAQFFPDARLNYAENLLRRRDSAPALIARDEKGRDRIFTFADLYDAVSKCAHVLRAAGVVQGDRVAGLMPNLPETIIAHLATASLGAIWSSASPDFGVQGILDRFGQIEPKVFIACDGYFYGGKTIDCLEKIKEVQKKINGLQKIMIVPFAQDAPDLSALPTAQLWPQALSAHAPTPISFARVPFNHPLVIMFSSGTTGVPKCIVHSHGGVLLTHLKEHQLQSDVKNSDRMFYFTTCGWMMWNWLVTGLASGATLLLYDGSPFHPSPLALWEFTEKYDCTLFGTAAKYIDALKANDVKPKTHFSLKTLRTLTSTGSPLVHESFDYIYAQIKSDLHVASVSGGTDVISCFMIGNPISPVWRGELQGAGLGYAMDVYDDEGKPMRAGQGSGEMVCVKPFPSMPVKFWNDPDGAKYHKAYFERFPNVWCHGDWMEKTVHEGYIIHGRSDATLNPGGVRIGTAEIYRQVEQIPEVLESIAVGQHWENDERIILFLRLKNGITLTEDLIARIKLQIRNGASPRHVPAKILQVTDIPRTKSNKIVELAVREVIHGRPVKNIEALANPEALDLYKNLPDLK